MAKTIEKLPELLERVLELDARKYDLVADTRAMNAYLNGGLRLQVDNPSGVDSFTLSDHMRGQIATDLGIPKRYFDRMRSDAPELLVTNVNHWLAHEPHRRMVRAYRDEDHFTGRAWLSDRYRRLDNIQVARKLLPEFEGLGTEVVFHQAAITESALYVRAVLPKLETEIKVGDVVQWGVQIRNSEIGAGMLGIEGFLLRLVCKNGMTATKVLNRRHVGRVIDEDGVLSDEALRADDKAFWLVARDMLRAAVSETRFEEVVSRLRDTTESEEIVAPIKATEVLQKQYSFSDDEREWVLQKLVVGGDLTQWGALNAVTAAAQQAKSFERQAEMEAVGWSIANLDDREWAVIAR